MHLQVKHTPRFEPADKHPHAPIVAEGEAAPDFELLDDEGRPFRLRDLRGQWVVLYFYPEDHAPGCTTEAKRFRDYFEAISLHQAAVVGVSRDNAGNHCSFRQKYALPFALLCDEDAAVHDLYGAWRPPLVRRNVVEVRRCTFLIDPDGVVAKVYEKARPLGHAQEVVHDLERLVASRKRKETTDAPAQG